MAVKNVGARFIGLIEGPSTGSFLENLPRGGKIEIFGYEGGRGSIHGNTGLHAF